jgi:hypothetical protein
MNEFGAGKFTRQDWRHTLHASNSVQRSSNQYSELCLSIEKAEFNQKVENVHDV